MCSVPYNSNDLSYVCQIDKLINPSSLWFKFKLRSSLLEYIKSQSWSCPLVMLILLTKWTKACLDWKWPLLKKYIWNKNEDLFCKMKLLFSLRALQRDWRLMLQAARGVNACGLVLKLFSLWFASHPMLLSFSFFSSSTAFEHRTPILPPPKLHIPAPWFHGTRRISPAMPSGCLLTLAGGTDGNINSPQKSKTVSVYF